MRNLGPAPCPYVMPDLPRLEIHLFNEFSTSDSRPLFLASSRLQGAIHLSNTTDTSPDVIKVVLQGTLLCS
jgi:hypothetical protein